MKKKHLLTLTLLTAVLFVVQESFAQLDRSTWSATACSTARTTNEGPASYAIDGINTTWWHTRYDSNGEGPTSQNCPAWIQFDLGSTQSFDEFNYVSRTGTGNSCNGNVNEYALYVSDTDISANITAWSSTGGYVPTDAANATLVSEGAFDYTDGSASSAMEHIVSLSSTVSGRYVYLLCKSSYGSAGANKFANCAEFYLYSTTVTSTPTITPKTGTQIKTGDQKNAQIKASGTNITYYYTLDGTEPTIDSPSTTDGIVAIPTNEPGTVTLKAVAKAANKDLSEVAAVSYVISDSPAYCTINTSGTTGNFATVKTLSTTNLGDFNLSYTNPNQGNSANYYQQIIAATSNMRVARGASVEMSYLWGNAWWSGFSVFMDLNGDHNFDTATERIIHGNGLQADQPTPKLSSENPSSAVTTTVNIAADAEFGTHLIRAVSTASDDACSNRQKVIDIEFMICPNITVTAENGTVTGTTGLVPVNTTVTLTAIPNEGHHFVSWTLNGEVVSNDIEYTTTKITEDRNYVANFAFTPIEPRQITVVSSSPAKGEVYITSPETTEKSITTGEVVTVEAVVTGSNNYFVNWTDQEGSIVSTNTTYRYAKAPAATLTANFETRYEVTVTQAVGGTITVKNGDKVVSSGEKISEGTNLTITVSVSAGKGIDNLYVNGVDIYSQYEKTGSYTFAISSPATITAIYGEPKCKLYYEYSGAGYVEVWSSDTYIDDDPANLPVRPDGDQYKAGDLLPYAENVYVFAPGYNGSTLESLEIDGIEYKDDENFQLYGDIEVSVSAPVRISARFSGTSTGVEESNAVASDKVYGIVGSIVIDSQESTVAEIYSSNGQLISTPAISGNTTISAKAGFYIVKIGTAAYKVVVK